MSSHQRFTKNEEQANAFSHGMGLLLSIIATVVLLYFAVFSGNAWLVASCAIFGYTMILLYFSSTMNHSLSYGKAKDFFHNFDQIAIYLLIAGTYTPLALSVIRHDRGWMMFGIQWGIALAGIIAKTMIPNKFEKGVNVFVIISYVIMGWLLLLFINPLYKNLSTLSFLLIFAGGFFYTGGILFFKMKRLKYAHLIWHLMVIGGSACHWLAIFLFVIK